MRNGNAMIVEFMKLIGMIDIDRVGLTDETKTSSLFCTLLAES